MSLLSVPFEITTRWGDTLLEIDHADASFALCGVPLIADGALVAPPTGRVALVDYEIRAVTPPIRELPLARTDDRRVVPYLVAALAVHLAVWALAAQETVERAAPVATAPRLRAAAVSRAFDDEHAELPDAASIDRGDDTKGDGRAAAARGSEGRAGAPQAPRNRGQIAAANTGEEPQLAKAEQLERARHAGILGDTKVLADQFRSLTGDDKLTSGFDDRHDVTAAFDGADGAARGTFGMGRIGEGIGGGGLHTIGRADEGGAFSAGTSHGHAWGGSTAFPTTSWSEPWNGRYDAAYIPARLGIRAPRVVICGEPYRERCHVTGGLDPAIVRRYVRRDLAHLSYCYDKELLARPNLAGGPLFIDFAINANGRVEGGKTANFDAAVSSCVADVFARMEFPAAAETRVEYVLVFGGAPQIEVGNGGPAGEGRPSRK